MITEDYISFETAKLLKEKGFDEKCFQYWHEEDNELVHSQSMHAIQNVSNPCFFGPAAPTLHVAMKWLRETKDIQVVIGILNTIKKTWTFALFRNFDELTQKFYSFKTYEEACEAGIRYVLENLI